MFVWDNNPKVVAQMQQCTFFFFKMRMCVAAVVGKTQLQCVLLSTQRRETAVRTRGCTDKSPKVLRGFTGVLTIAALGDFDWTVCIHKSTLSQAPFSPFLQVLLCVPCLNWRHTICLVATTNCISELESRAQACLVLPFKVLFLWDFLHKLRPMSEMKWSLDSLFTFKLCRRLWNVPGEEMFLFALNGIYLTSVYSSDPSEARASYSGGTWVPPTYATLCCAL